MQLPDLRFGRVRPEPQAPLIEAVNGLRPDLAVVSADLTQRARTAQFRETRALLDALTAPWLAVPGNHDAPLDRPSTRLLRPYAGYRRWIDRTLAPHKDTGAAQGQWLSADRWLEHRESAGLAARRADAGTDRATRVALAAPEQTLRVIVAHHPVVHQPQERKALLRGARAGLSALAKGRTDVVLSGHLHSWRAAPCAPDGDDAWAMLMVQADAGLSTRLRGAPHGANLPSFGAEGLTVSRFTAGEPAFFAAHTQRFERGAQA